MVVHLWGKFFMAAWRGRRALTWMTGAVAFLVSIATAFTGYLTQQNFDSQWIGDAGEGRPQRLGSGRVLQRPQLRPDAAVARRAARRSSSRCSSAGTSCSSGGAASARRCRAKRPGAGDRRAMSSAGYPIAPDPVGRVERRQAALRHRQGGGHRARRRRRAHRPARGALLLAGRASR